MRLGASGALPAMTDAELRMFCELLRRHCGLHFGPESRFLLEKRIGHRLRELGLGSFAAYHYALRKDAGGDPELGRLIDDVTTHETYFFRERSQLRALVEEILPPLVAQQRQRQGRPVAIWSAGCSSGEEPYSVVMEALDAGFVPGRDLRVYASDIAGAMLQKARRGLYREASLRQTDPAQRRRWFKEQDGLWRVADAVKRQVDFIQLNLLDRSKIALLGLMDVILCRNVMIYFDTDTRRRVIQTFHEKLRTGGYLLLGHSESLINVSSAFELCHLKHDLVYRRSASGDAAPEPGGSRARPWRAREAGDSR